MIFRALYSPTQFFTCKDKLFTCIDGIIDTDAIDLGEVKKTDLEAFLKENKSFEIVETKTKKGE